MIVTMVSENRK